MCACVHVRVGAWRQDTRACIVRSVIRVCVCGHLDIYVHVCVIAGCVSEAGVGDSPAGMALPTSELATASPAAQKALCVCMSLGL